MGASAEYLNGGLVILVYDARVKKGGWASSVHIPRILFVVAIALVMVDGYYRTESANNIVHIGDPIYSAALYTLALLGILGVHDGAPCSISHT